MKCVEVYKELYHQEPFDVAFCPYRISPLGAHIDHQYGKINGLAIDKGIHMAYHPKQNGVVELQSLNFPKRAQFFVSAVPDEKQGDWADHLRGAARVDLYMANNNIYFGELTFTDGAGSDPFTPRSFDLEMAKRIKLGRVLQNK